MSTLATDPVDPEEPTTPIVLDPPGKGTITFDENGNWIYTPNPKIAQSQAPLLWYQVVRQDKGVERDRDVFNSSLFPVI